MLTDACQEKGVEFSRPEKLIAKAAFDYAAAMISESEKAK